MKVTGCECTQAGWCERHQCEKNEYWLSMCRRVPDLFAAWESGAGPAPQTSHPSFNPASRRCIHRDGEMRRERCDTCQGEVLLKIFACELHQECTLSRKLGQLRCCARCVDYHPSPDENTEELS